jgi:putative nucleotidyltransferase-like protein
MPEPRTGYPEAGDELEVSLLLSCARTQISPECSARIQGAVRKDINWLALIRLAMRHDVMPLLYRSLEQVCPDSVPQSIFGPLRARYEAQAAEARSRAEELVRILSLFEEQGIPAVPYKGPTLAQRLYGDLSMREFGDLDIMIPERDVPRAQDLIRCQGYTFAFLKNAAMLAPYIRANRELQFRRFDGGALELHWRFAMRQACVKHDPERFLERLETISLVGAQVPSLPLEVYLLILAMHATKHKWRQLKLICDFAEIVGQPGLDWQYVLREADDLGLKRMLAVGILLAEDPLEAVAPAELVQALKTDRAAQALAAQVRRSLFLPPDENWHREAEYQFQFEIRERLQDRARMFFWNWWPRISRRFVTVPDWYAD